MWRNEELNLAPIQLKLLEIDSSGLIPESESLFVDVGVAVWGSSEACNVSAGEDICYTRMDVSN